MRIATKLTLLLLLSGAVVMAAFGFVRVQQERQRLIVALQQDLVVVENTMRLVVEHALRDRQPQDIRELFAEPVRDPGRTEPGRTPGDLAAPGSAAERSASRERGNLRTRPVRPERLLAPAARRTWGPRAGRHEAVGEREAPAERMHRASQIANHPHRKETRHATV